MTINEPDSSFTSSKAEPTEAATPPKPDQGAQSGGFTVKDPVDILRSLGNTTSRVVEEAASILEQEIAAGIIAAKQVEERMINVREVRSGKPDEVMQRFRRDAHEVVDIVLDLVSVATKSIGDVTQRVISIRTGNERGTNSSPSPSEVPTLAMPKAVKAGEAVEAPMTLENDSDTKVVHFSFRCSDLVSDSGDRIAATEVTTVPATLTLNPRQTEQVKITVNVPAGTPVGSYAGLLQATNLNNLRAVLVVQVH